MNKHLLLALTAAALFPSIVFADDSDPGTLRSTSYGDGSTVTYSGGPAVPRPAYYYYQPTQRYYGKGYIVSYRYVPAAKRQRTATRPNGDPFWVHSTAPAIYTGKSPRVRIATSRLTPVVVEKTTTTTTTIDSSK